MKLRSWITHAIVRWMRAPEHRMRLRLIDWAWRIIGTPVVEIPYLSRTRLQVDPRDYIGRHIILEGAYEGEIYEFISERLRSVAAAVFVDIGSHVGTFSVPLSRDCAVVHAVDANPRVVEMLVETLGRNGITNVRAYHCAISETAGPVSFFVATDGNSGMSSLSPHWSESVKQIEVPSYTLEAFLNEHSIDRVTVMKIDAEGSGAAILKSGGTALTRILCVVAEDGPDMDEARDLLTELGYNVTYPFTASPTRETRRTLVAERNRRR